MSQATPYRIAVIPGDGIGVEVTAVALQVLREAQRRVGGFRLDFEELPAGAFCYRDTGEALPRASVDAAARADAILLGACGWPEIRYPDGTEIRPQVELRFILDPSLETADRMERLLRGLHREEPEKADEGG